MYFSNVLESLKCVGVRFHCASGLVVLLILEGALLANNQVFRAKCTIKHD